MHAMTEEQERAAQLRRISKRWAALNALASGQSSVSRMLQGKAHAKKMLAGIEAGDQRTAAEVDTVLSEYLAGRTIITMGADEVVLAEKLYDYSSL